MGFPFRIADCVEDGRDKNHSIKIHRSPGRAAKAQENPADGNWRVRYAETIPAVGCLIHRHVDSRITRHLDRWPRFRKRYFEIANYFNKISVLFG
jgi:hypothetical protein